MQLIMYSLFNNTAENVKTTLTYKKYHVAAVATQISPHPLKEYTIGSKYNYSLKQACIYELKEIKTNLLEDMVHVKHIE